MDPIAVLGVAALVLVKEAGLPIPVPGDLVVIGLGVAAAGRPVPGLVALGVILVAGYVGGAVQFGLVRGPLRARIVRLLGRLGVAPARIESLAERLRTGGARAVAIARATPGVRVAAIAASGLAALRFWVFGRGLVAGNGVFVTAHFALGFALGPAAISIAGRASTLAVVAIGLAAAGAVAWVLLSRRRRPGSLPALPVEAWADAACPACLAIAAFRAGEGRTAEG